MAQRIDGAVRFADHANGWSLERELGDAHLVVAQIVPRQMERNAVEVEQRGGRVHGRRLESRIERLNCIGILNDPALLFASSIDPRAIRRRFLNFHGRFLPTTPFDPEHDFFVVTISNATGAIYRAELPATSLVLRKNRRYAYQNPDRESVVALGGIDRLFVRRRQDVGAEGYEVRVRALEDFSRDTLPLMTTQIHLGDDVAYLTASWHFQQGRWRLQQNDFERTIELGRLDVSRPRPAENALLGARAGPVRPRRGGSKTSSAIRCGLSHGTALQQAKRIR